MPQRYPPLSFFLSVLVLWIFAYYHRITGADVEVYRKQLLEANKPEALPDTLGPELTDELPHVKGPWSPDMLSMSPLIPFLLLVSHDNLHAWYSGT